jgi:hypothetical protein
MARPFADVEWRVEPDKDGQIPNEQATHALLMDLRGELTSIRKLLGSIRGMLIFFVIVTVVGLVIGALVALTHL